MNRYTIHVVVEALTQDAAFVFVEEAMDAAVKKERHTRERAGYLNEPAGVSVSTPEGSRRTEFD